MHPRKSLIARQITAVGSKKRNPGSSRRNTLVTHKAALGASRLVLVVKNTPANGGDVRDTNLIPGLGQSCGGGHGNPRQYSCLANAHGQRSLAGYGP